jgi:hypothetical protein
MEGRFTIGMQGFGRSKVRGRRRVPSPPHMMQTFITTEWAFIGFKRAEARADRPLQGLKGKKGSLVLDRGGQRRKIYHPTATSTNCIPAKYGKTDKSVELTPYMCWNIHNNRN